MKWTNKYHPRLDSLLSSLLLTIIIVFSLWMIISLLNWICGGNDIIPKNELLITVSFFSIVIVLTKIFVYKKYYKD